MRILVDENIPRMTVDALGALGNDVKDIRGTPAQGIVRLRQPNRHKIHRAVMRAIQEFQESEWRNLFVVVRDTTMNKSRSGGA